MDVGVIAHFILIKQYIDWLPCHLSRGKHYRVLCAQAISVRIDDWLLKDLLRHDLFRLLVEAI